MKIKALIYLFGFLMTFSSLGSVQFETFHYKQGDTDLEGVHVFDKRFEGKRPGILICHQWMGLSDYERVRATMLAELGYSVFCADIYGRGNRPSNRQEAAALAGKFKGDRGLLRARVNAALDALRHQTATDPDRVAALGYCFGGTTALELARSGAEVLGVVSFHGGLSSPTPESAKRIQCKVLVLHGAEDPHVPAAEVAAFKDEMRAGKVDWQFVSYGGAVHSFTDWNAGNDPSQGVAYNEKADERSWEVMKDFLDELFTGTSQK